MDLEIDHWNNNNSINNINNTDNNEYNDSKPNLLDSITNDSNYVSEDSVTLTEGSIEKDEDSLDNNNIYSMANSISIDTIDNIDYNYSNEIITMEKSSINQNGMLINELNNNSVKIQPDGKYESNGSVEINENVESQDECKFYDCIDEGYNNNFHGNTVSETFTDNNNKNNERINGFNDDSSLLNLSQQDFSSSNWLISSTIQPKTNEDNKFDFDSVSSFKKIKLSSCTIFEQFSLHDKLKYPKPSTSYQLTAANTLSMANESPVDYYCFSSSNIKVNSTPYSTKQNLNKNERKKNETYSKSGSIDLQFQIGNSVENDVKNENNKNKTFSLEEESPKEINERIDLNIINNEEIEKKQENPIKLRKTFLASGEEKIQNRLSKKLESIFQFQKKDKIKNNDNDIDDNKSKIKPPSNALRKNIFKSFSRDSIATKSLLNKAENVTKAPPDALRRHTIVEQSSPSIPVNNSRPTSLIKPQNEMKPPIGNTKRIAKPVARPSKIPGKSNNLSASIPPQPQPPKLKEEKSERGLLSRKTSIKSLKQQKSNIQTNFNNRNNKPIEQPNIASPILSENPPIISPTCLNPNDNNNPLNRTFDREQFQTLKLSDNNNCSDDNTFALASSSETVRSMLSTDSDSNNNNNHNRNQISHSSEQLKGIYEIALKEEENLKNQVNNSALAIRPKKQIYRSLKLPSEIKSRGIPLLKK